MLSMDLTGRTAVVTGGESGIGREIARVLGEAGASIAITYRENQEAAEHTLDPLRALGRRVYAAKCDVGDEHAVAHFFDAIERTIGVATILVCAAGVNAHDKTVEELDLAEWNEVLRTNLTGPFLCTQRYLRSMEASDGRIIIVTSVHQSMPAIGVAEYAASKGGLHMFVRCLALELAPRRITVNALAPGTVLTAMTQDLLDDPGALRSHERTIPLGRAGRTEDVAAMALFLCSRAADYITGTSIVIDGGMLLNVATGEPFG